MLTLEQKKLKFQDFIRSDNFGFDTWTILLLFNQNTHNIILSNKLYEVLIKRLDEGNIPNNLDDFELLRAKQHIYLDIIMKIEVLIESLLVMVHSLSKGYLKVPSHMTFYDSVLVRTIIDKVKKNYNMRKVLGLPNLTKLPLTTDERKLILKEYKEFEKASNTLLIQLVDFYEDFRIIYGKLKHGLTIQTGLGFQDNNMQPKF